MLRKRNVISYSFLLLLLLVSCTSSKNTSGTRWYHAFNTRYNVYYNGKLAYDESLKALQDNYEENYSEMILMYPVSSLPKDKQNPGGSFDRSIEKSAKAIKQHSIQTKPKRKTGKRNDPKYIEFMSRTEYNPFLYNAWLLMGKSQFHNGDFLLAATTFSYVSRLYNTQPLIANEAKIWHARSYAEMDWYYEAEGLLAKIDTASLSKSKDLRNLWASTKADLLIKQKEYDAAIPYLQTSIKAEKNGRQRERQKYLLGQIYTTVGDRDLAYRTFGQISSARAPYVLEFSAKIRQTEVYQGGNAQKSVKQLEGMAKSSKNKDYLDQVYYALGNVYLSIPDTTKAIESYETGVIESTRNGIDKALNQIQLGDLYFELRDYVNAQPNYSGSLAHLKKGDAAYSRVSKRSEVLDELLIYHEAVVLQDSLLRLSEMTAEQQMKIVQKIIEDLIKAEKEEQERADREEFLANRESTQAANRPAPLGTVPQVTKPGSSSEFYFYNTQAVAQGRSLFQQKWGRRKLEDDWRRNTKNSHLSDFEQTDLAETEEEENIEEGGDELAEEVTPGTNARQEKQEDLVSDTKDPQFYLQQIPKTEEEKAESHLIIADGLYNMAVIYKDKLEDSDLALETFDELDTRYPENDNKMEAYYHTYMIYFRRGDMAMANEYKQRLRTEFPESAYAVAMADPNYEYNLKMMYVLQDSIYNATYDAYLAGNAEEIRKNYDVVTEKYSQSKLMPKFIFLNALSYVQTGDSDKFKEGLKTLIDKYPEDDVSLLASEMMKGFQRGLTLSGDGMIAKGSLFNLRLGTEEDYVEDPSELVFTDNQQANYQLLLIYPKGYLNDNLLLYAVAYYNYGNFQVNDFELEIVPFNEITMFRISTFHNLGQVLQYTQMIQNEDGYVNQLGPEVLILPISTENYDLLMKGKSINEYMDFFEEHYEKGNENLISRWNLLEEEEEEIIQEEIEELDVVVPVPEEKKIEEKEETSEEREEIVEEKEDVSEQKEEEIIIEEETEDDLLEEAELEELEEVVLLEEKDSSGEEVIVIEVVEKESETEEEIIEEVEEFIWEEEKEESSISKFGKGLLEKLGIDVKEVIGVFEEEEEEEFIEEEPAHSILDYVKEQEEAEKIRLEQEKKDKKQADKDAAKLKKQQEKEKKEAQKLKEKQRKEALKAKEQEKKRKEKERREAQKKKEQERKEAQKLKEKQRKEAQKLKEEQRRAEQKRKEEEKKASKKK